MPYRGSKRTGQHAYLEIVMLSPPQKPSGFQCLHELHARVADNLEIIVVQPIGHGIRHVAEVGLLQPLLDCVAHRKVVRKGAVRHHVTRVLAACGLLVLGREEGVPAGDGVESMVQFSF